MISSVISGTGSFVPKNVIRNEFFIDSDFVDENGNVFPVDNKTIIRKFEEITEIRERRYLDSDMINSDMAAIAGHRAIRDAKLDKEQIDYIIAAHNFADVSASNGIPQLMPSLSSRIKNKLGIQSNTCIPYDMIFGCPGWLEGLIMAHHLIQGGNATNILVIGSDTLYRNTDPHDRNKMIFADGAGAVILSAKEKGDKTGVISHYTVSDNKEEVEYLKNDKSLKKKYKKNRLFIRMQGRKIYNYALKNVPTVVQKTIEKSGVQFEKIKKVIIHQANAKMDYAIMIRILKMYGIKKIPNNLMPMTIQKYGNSSVATIPTMYDEILKGKMPEHSINKNDYIVFVSVGAGMTINAMVYKQSK